MTCATLAPLSTLSTRHTHCPIVILRIPDAHAVSQSRLLAAILRMPDVHVASPVEVLRMQDAHHEKFHAKMQCETWEPVHGIVATADQHHLLSNSTKKRSENGLAMSVGEDWFRDCETIAERCPVWEIPVGEHGHGSREDAT